MIDKNTVGIILVKQIIIIFAVFIGLSISGCGSNSSSDNDYGGRSGSDKGRLTLSITDGPIDEVTEVWVQFTAIELKPADSSSTTITFDAPVDINLLNLQGSLSQDFFNAAVVDSGAYNWVRLAVNADADGTFDSYLVMKDGSEHELHIPSGSQTGLKINTGFTVVSNTEVAMTIDFDLRKSIVMSGSDYHLKPVLRMVENEKSGSTSGSIVDTVTGCPDDLPDTGNAVYIFSGADAEVDDIDGNLPEPVTTALLSLNVGTGEYDYEIGFLPEGNYTVAYTCMADQDDPKADDAIIFSQVTNVTVSSSSGSTGGAEFNR